MHRSTWQLYPIIWDKIICCYFLMFWTFDTFLCCAWAKRLDYPMAFFQYSRCQYIFYWSLKWIICECVFGSCFRHVNTRNKKTPNPQIFDTLSFLLYFIFNTSALSPYCLLIKKKLKSMQMRDRRTLVFVMATS